jgi:anti-sigma factor RsiW
MDTLRQNCPFEDIAAYVDGELTLERELEVETHFSACAECYSELNDQKAFLRALDQTLRQGDLELPADFTKVVVANAESSVAGLRRSQERYHALFICIGLSLFVLFALGSQAENVVDQASAVASFFARFIYSFFIGVAIIIRNVASQSQFGASTVVFLTVIFAALALFVSRRVSSMRDA